MKRNAKIITLAIAAAMLLCLALGFASSAETAAPEVVAKNVKVDGNFCLMFAVDPDTVAGDDVTLKIYAETPAEGVSPIYTITKAKTDVTLICLDADSQIDDPAIVFETAGVSAKDIADQWYYTVESAGAVSDVATYSVREYAFERLYGDNKIAAEDDYGMKQRSFYLSILRVGSNAQNLLVNTKLEAEGKAPEKLANEYFYAAIFGGSFGGVTQKFVELGDTLTLTADAGVAAFQVSSYGKDGALLNTKSVNAGQAVQISGNTVISPDPNYGKTPGQYFAQIGDQRYSFDDTSVSNWNDLVRNFRHTGADSVTKKDYGYRINKVVDDVHGKVIGTGKEADDGNGATIYFPMQDLANGKGNVIVFEGEICLDKGVFTYYDSDIKATEALSNAIYFAWLDMDFTEMHNKDWNNFGTRIASTGFNMIDTDPSTLVNNVGGDGLRHYKNSGDIQLEFGKWYQVCFELYMTEGKGIFYLNGVKTATWTFTANAEAVATIQSMGLCSMWRLTDSELLLNNVFCGKIIKEYPAQ